MTDELGDMLRLFKLATERADRAEVQLAEAQAKAAERNAALERAEKAEAQVREYEDHPPGIGDADIQRIFRQRDALAARVKELEGALLRFYERRDYRPIDPDWTTDIEVARVALSGRGEP